MSLPTKPNLFHFATSELSQDAVLCWLLTWAKPEHAHTSRTLHRVATDLLTLIHDRAKAPIPHAFTSVEVTRQAANIDILCVVNAETAIIIEDKVGTKQHSDQLARYKDHVLKELGFPAAKTIPVYVQTGDQSDYSEATKHGYSVLERADLLRIFESDNGIAARKESDVLDSFATYLRQVEDDVQSYLSLPPNKWTWNSWKGFYSHPQRTLGQGTWDYVANPSGGFLGFWWHFVEAEDCEAYLQLEQDKFCFKLCVETPEKVAHLRQYWHNLIMSKCPARGLRARRPPRFGSGTYITVAILDQEFRAVDKRGLLDMEATLKLLRAAQTVLDDCGQAAPNEPQDSNQQP